MIMTWINVKTVQQSKFLFQKKLCYGCYMPVSTDHNLRTCKQRRVCDTCGEKHPTGLHGYKDSRKKKDALGGNSQKSDSTLTCPTSKMKSNVVSNSKKEFRTQIVAVRQPSLTQTWPES